MTFEICLPAVRHPEAVLAGVQGDNHAQVEAAGRGRGRLLLQGHRARRRGHPQAERRGRAARNGRGQILHPLLPSLKIRSQVCDSETFFLVGRWFKFELQGVRMVVSDMDLLTAIWLLTLQMNRSCCAI